MIRLERQVAILIADYGYDTHQLNLTDDEVRLIKSRLELTKTGPVWSESAGCMIDGYWSFDFKANEYWIHCDDGLSFDIHDFWIE